MTHIRQEVQKRAFPGICRQAVHCRKMAAHKNPDQVVRCFEVGNPRLHEKGHTIYQVTLKVSDRRS